MKINGNSSNLTSSVPLIELLLANDYDPGRIAVELNGNIVPKKEYADVIVGDSDSLEIVCFVGGG